MPVGRGSGGRGHPDLIKLLRWHSLMMLLVFQQWLFTQVFDREKMLESFLNSKEQKLGLLMCEVSVLGAAVGALNENWDMRLT